jgi:type II secretory pathway pseudopilin PulG
MTQTIHLQKNSRRGTTLVEVLLGAVILAILAVTALTALFYPRQLAVSQGLKRAAINAATDEIERLHSTPYANVVPGTQPVRNLSGFYNINGRTVTATTTVQRVSATFSGRSYEYHFIHTAVSYPGGESPVVMEAVRSP